MAEEKKKKRAKNRSPEAVARRRVRSAYEPPMNALDREKSTAKNDLEFITGQINNIYSGLQDILGPLYGRYNEANSEIAQNYGDAIGQYSSTFTEAPGVGLVAGAGDAANAAAGAAATTGAGGFNLLAGDAARTNAFLSRMPVVGALAQKDAAGNALTEYRNFIDELRSRKLDLRDQKAADRLALVDQIIAQRRQNRLQDRELDIAEEQFNKEFGLRKNEQRHDNRQERRAQNTTEEFLTDEQARKRLKRVNTRLGNVKGNLKTTNAAISEYGGYTDPANRDYVEGLEEKRQRLRQKKKRLKRKRRTLRNEVND